MILSFLNLVGSICQKTGLVHCLKNDLVLDNQYLKITISDCDKYKITKNDIQIIEDENGVHLLIKSKEKLKEKIV